MDHRAIEAAEEALEAHIKIGLANGDPKTIAVTKLRKAFVRVWVGWLTDVKAEYPGKSSNITLNAACSFVAGIVAEMATNYWDRKNQADGAQQILERIAEEAFATVTGIQTVDDGGNPEGFDVVRAYINLVKKSDG